MTVHQRGGGAKEAKEGQTGCGGGAGREDGRGRAEKLPIFDYVRCKGRSNREWGKGELGNGYFWMTSFMESIHVHHRRLHVIHTAFNILLRKKL